MEAQLANLTAWVHYHKSESAATAREDGPPPRSLSSVKSLAESSDTFPASSNSKPKEEIASISAPNHVVSQKGLSDHTDSSGSQRHVSASSLPVTNGQSPNGQSTPRHTQQQQAQLQSQVCQLKSDLQAIRRQQQLNTEAMRDEISNTFAKIKSVISAKPGADNQVNVQRRVEATQVKQTYQSDKHQVDKELSDLEFSVEELRNDVISRQCRVNMVDVEGMALLLSNLTKQMADLKARFPEIQDQMKQVMDGELRQVVAEEKFLKEEPNKIESSLKRCKKMTETLYTLKRLATVQDHRAPQVPTLPPASELPEGDNKMAVLENIRALVPDHEQRVQHMEAADAARERKKKISTQQESLKFGKGLEMASKNLKPTAGGDKVTEEKVTASQASTVSTSTAAKPAIPTKPSARVTFSNNNNSSSNNNKNTATSSSSVIITSTQNSRPSFSASSVKTTEKPTATVSALTSITTPATNTVSAIASKESHSVIKGVSSTVTETATVCSSSQNGRGKIVTNSQTDTSKKTEPSSPVKLTTPVKPPVFTRPPTLGISGINRSPTRDANKLVRKDSDKSGTKISFSDKVQRIPPKEVTSPLSPTSAPPSNEDEKVINGVDTVKIDLATQKQAARSAFFSSMSPTTPDVKSPNRDSATLDLGPVLRPGPTATVVAGAASKTNAGQTINLVLSGTVSPQSSSNPGAFAINPPKDLVSPTSTSTKSPLSSPSKSSSIPVSSDKPSSNAPLSPSSLDSEENSSDVVLRNKKVPPPPPPRKTSRPTSASLSPPLNGRASVSEESSSPRFVGGVLGQHRLSGGPLSSTPKPTAQNSLSKLDKDITSGPHSKNQKNFNQPLTSNSSPASEEKVASVPCGDAEKCAHTLTSDYLPPPPPHVTMALDREERGSSSESTSSSSGQSMGSQQSVINVVAAKLANDPPSSGPKSPNSSNTSGAAKPPNTSTFSSSSKSSKPDPPRRHSSLLSKFTGSSRDSKTHASNGKANVNGVDL